MAGTMTSSFGSGFTSASFANNNSAFTNAFTYSPPTPLQITPVNSTPISNNPTATGIDAQALEALLYGKDRPLYVGGLLRIGGRIIEGPYWSGTQSDPKVSYIACLAQAVKPDGGQQVIEFDLRGAKYWDASGEVYNNPAVLDAGQLEIRTGTATQLPFASSIARHGLSADAYRTWILVEVKEIPVKPFGGMIPMPSGVVTDQFDSDGITRQEAIERILRFARMSDDEFEINVPGIDQAWLITSQIGRNEFLRSLRQIFVNYSITFGDKLRITDTTDFPISAVLTRANIVKNSFRLKKADPLLIPRQKTFTYIDVDRDYEPHPATAILPVYPTPTTDSVESSAVELGIVMTNAEAMALVNAAAFEEQAIQSQFRATLQRSLFGTMPGDVAQFADHDFINVIGRTFETKHDFTKWTNGMQAAEVLNCGALPMSGTIFLSVDNTFGEDTDDEGYGYAPVVAADLPATLPAFTNSNYMDFRIGDAAQNGTALQLVVDTEERSRSFTFVFMDDDYVYYLERQYNTPAVSAELVRVSLADFSDNGRINWGAHIYAELGVVGQVYSAELINGKLIMAMSSAPNFYLISIDVADFTTSGISYVTIAAQLRALGAVGLGDYVYFSAFDVSSGVNSVIRVAAASLSHSSIASDYRQGRGVADAVSGKVFFSPIGRDPFESSTWPTRNDRMVAVVDTNVTWNDDALDHFAVTQDTNVDFAIRETAASYTGHAPWIVSGSVRLLCEAAAGDVFRIASFSVADYSVADSGYDLSAYFVFGSTAFPLIVRTFEGDQYIVGSQLATGVLSRTRILKLSNGYASAELLNSEV